MIQNYLTFPLTPGKPGLTDPSFLKTSWDQQNNRLCTNYLEKFFLKYTKCKITLSPSTTSKSKGKLKLQHIGMFIQAEQQLCWMHHLNWFHLIPLQNHLSYASMLKKKSYYILILNLKKLPINKMRLINTWLKTLEAIIFKSICQTHYSNSLFCI